MSGDLQSDVPVCEATVESLTEHPNGKSRALRRVAQKNALEKSAYEEMQRRLEFERRSRQSEMHKEEKDMKDHLHRLLQERLMLADLEEINSGQ